MLQLPPFRYLSSHAALYAGVAVAPAVADSYFTSVVYLSGYEGADASTATVDEATGKAVTTVGNAQVNTAQFKFGTSSLLLDGSGDYLTLEQHSDWNYGTSPFTIEAWVRFATGSKEHTIISHGSFALERFSFAYHGGGSVLRFAVSGNGTSSTLYDAAWSPLINTWYHVAVDRDATNKLRLYVNGAMIGFATDTIAPYAGTAAQVRVGSRSTNAPGADFQGWLDEVRFTKGVARYASDSGYVVPTAAFPRFGSTVTVTSASSFSKVEGTTAVATLTATGGSITWSLVGGADVAKFSINSSTGALSFLSPPAFATPTDADGNNVYIVQVQATNPASSDTKTLNVTVTIAFPALTGIIGRWDASAAASLTLSGTDILAVADQSAAGNNLSWSGFGKPVYSATGFNSKPAFMIDGKGVGNAFTKASFPMGTGNTLTCWYVGNFNPAKVNASAGVIAYTGAGQSQSWNNANSFLLYNHTNGTQIAFTRSSTDTLRACTANANHRVIVTVNSSGVITIYVDGLQIGATATVAGNWTSPGTLDIFRNETTYWGGQVGEVGIATGYSDATTVAQLDTYLKNKWGL